MNAVVDWTVKAWNAMIEWLGRPVQFEAFKAVFFLVCGIVLTIGILNWRNTGEDEDGESR